jgi:ribulose-5-phosphate 4-epimerase/fuculose-1-phosphate aldolase
VSRTYVGRIDTGLLDDLGRRVVEVARGLFENKLVVSTFGVVSTRIPSTDYVLITPSGFSKARLDKENLIIVDL